MIISRLLVGSLTTLVFTGTVLANSPGPTLRDKQQAACYDDVQRLCGAVMPDVDKVTDCMKDKKPEVSAKCAALWDVN